MSSGLPDPPRNKASSTPAAATVSSIKLAKDVLPRARSRMPWAGKILLIEVYFFAESGASVKSLALELRRAPFEKGAHALSEISRSAGFALHLALEIQLLFVGVAGALPIKPPDQAQRDGRPVCQIARKVFRLVHQLRIVHDAINEAPLQRHLGGQSLAQQRKLHRARLAHKPRQNPGRAAVGHEPDTAKSLKKIRRACAQNEIAHQRETHPYAGRRSINCGDQRHRQLSKAAQERVVERFQHEPRIPRAARTGLQVCTRAEAAARAGHDYASERIRDILNCVNRLDQPAEHFRRDRIHDLGMVERENADRSFDIEFCAIEFHGFFLPVRSIARYCPSYWTPLKQTPRAWCVVLNS